MEVMKVPLLELCIIQARLFLLTISEKEVLFS